jgi:beta-mannosidase
MKSISLDGQWHFRSVTDTDWMKAMVPGDVHHDLLDNGKIEDPMYADNAEKCVWIEEKPWLYRKRFEIPKGFTKDRLELVFNGLDLDADITLNGSRIAEHHNAFIPCIVDVSDNLKEGRNEIIVQIDVGKDRVKDKPYKKYYGDDKRIKSRRYMRIFMRKPQYVFTYDWAPYLPTCGIWRPVVIRSYERAAIRDVCMRSRVSAPSAAVDVEIELESFAKEPLVVEAVFSMGENTYRERLSLHPGLNKASFTLDIANPRLWYPQPVGEPYLYNVALSIREGSGSADNDRGAELDTYATRFGIREIELVKEPIADGKSFVFTVNGRKVFCKGANWVPADSLPGTISKDKYCRLVSLAAEANFNMFRINGLCFYEDPLFYELCDEYGIMVWQDFMFGNALYPGDDPEFMGEVEREARSIVKQLRNHPSVAIWCGSNELIQEEVFKGARHYGLGIFQELLPRVLRELDPTRPYQPTSAYGGEDANTEDEGDRHTPPKGETSLGAFKGYARDRGKFISEFYQYGMPVKESLLEFTPPDQLFVGSPVWQYHNNTGELGVIKESLERHFISEEKLTVDEYIAGSQMVQAETFKFAIDHWRRRMYNTAGTLFWMYSDCWGTTAGWTIVDYYLRLKPSYYYIRRVFEPVHTSIKEAEPAEVWVLNETYENRQVDLEIGIASFDGEKLRHETRHEELPAAAARTVATIDTRHLPPARRSGVFCYSKMYEKGKLISQDRLFLVDLKDLDLPDPGITTSFREDGGSRYHISVKAARFAWMVSIYLPDGMSLSDNCFDLFPGDERTIEIQGPCGHTLSETDIHVSTLNDILNRHR